MHKKISVAEFRRALRPVLIQAYDRLPAADRDEMGIPAYLHPNPAMRWVYWRRLDLAMAAAGPSGQTALDFGCGPGVLLPVLSHLSRHVTAVDQHLAVARQVVEEFRLPNVDLLPTGNRLSLPDRSVDLIFALDVLEHVADLEGTLSELERILVPGGRIIISGPTENWIYRLGRRLAGFSGAYHARDVQAVLAAARRHLFVRRVWRLFTVCPLFLLVRCEKKCSE